MGFVYKSFEKNTSNFNSKLVFWVRCGWRALMGRAVVDDGRGGDAQLCAKYVKVSGFLVIVTQHSVIPQQTNTARNKLEKP